MEAVKKSKEDYTYGWIYYKAVKPNAIRDIQGKDTFETLRIYNASPKDPSLNLQIQGKLYVWLHKPAEKDGDPDLVPGTNIWCALTKDETENLIKQGLAAAKEDKKLLTRPEKRRYTVLKRKEYKNINVVKTIQAEEVGDEGS